MMSFERQNSVTADGESTFHGYCKGNKDVEKVIEMLRANSSLVTACDKHGMAPLHIAAQEGNIHLVPVLLAFNADANQENPKDKNTALHYANTTKNNVLLVRLLMTFAADPNLTNKLGQKPDIGLTLSDTQHFRQLTDIIRSRCIQSKLEWVKRGDNIRLNPRDTETHHPDTDDRTILFYYRKLPKEHICLCSASLTKYVDNQQMVVISDVYEYFVSKPVNKLQLEIEVHKAGSKYDNLFLVDSSGKHYDVKLEKLALEGMFVRATVKLNKFDANLHSFVVVMESKTDTFTVSESEQQITSTMDEKFQVKIESASFLSNTLLSMKVLPSREERAPTVDIMRSTSNFHEVKASTNPRNHKCLTVSIPLPDGCSSPSDVHVFSVNSPNYDDWQERRAITDSTGIAKIKSEGNTTCIAVECKPWTPGIMKTLSNFLCHLFDSVRRRQFFCRFYTLPRQLHISIYQILVGVADDTLVNGYIEEWEQNGYVNDPSYISAPFLCTQNTEYRAVLSSCSNTISIMGIQVLHLNYLKNKQIYVHSVVKEGREDDILTCAIDNTSVEATRCRSGLATLYIRLFPSTYPTLHYAYNYLRQTSQDFPCDDLLWEISQDIGYEKKMIGLCLGLSCALLTDLERGTQQDFNLKVLQRWRVENSRFKDRGLTKLIQTLHLVQREDIIEILAEVVHEFVTNNPEHEFSNWVKCTIKNSSHSDSDCLCITSRRPNISHFLQLDENIIPWSKDGRKYLVKLAHQLGFNEYLLITLGLPQTDINATKSYIRAPNAAMFECLLQVKQKFQNSTHFFKELLDALNGQNKIADVMTIIKDIRYGCQHDQSTFAYRDILQAYEQVEDRIQELTPQPTPMYSY